MTDKTEFFRQDAVVAYKRRLRYDTRQDYRVSLLSPLLALITSVVVLIGSMTVWINVAVL